MREVLLAFGNSDFGVLALEINDFGISYEKSFPLKALCKGILVKVTLVSFYALNLEI